MSGAVKTAGGLAAVFAVDPHPSPAFLVLLFLWLFFWEIGGQNIPNDWIDMEEDRMVQAKTIPVRVGKNLGHFDYFSISPFGGCLEWSPYAVFTLGRGIKCLWSLP